MISWLLPFVSANGLTLALCLGALAMFYTYDSSRVQAGREKERAKIEQANRKATFTADRVRNKSRSRSMRGIIDPNTID